MYDFGVTVSVIEPDFFATPMTKTSALQGELRAAYETLDENTKREYGPQFLEQGKHFRVKGHKQQIKN